MKTRGRSSRSTSRVSKALWRVSSHARTRSFRISRRSWNVSQCTQYETCTACTASHISGLQERHSSCKSSVFARGAFKIASGSSSGRHQWGYRGFHTVHYVARERSPGKIAANCCTGFHTLTIPLTDIAELLHILCSFGGYKRIVAVVLNTEQPSRT